MPAFTDLTTLSPNSIASSQGASLNHSVISSVLTLLGWQDKRSALGQAEGTDRILTDNLQAAYAQYLTLPDSSSAEHLNTVLTAVIDKLEKDQATAIRLSKQASDRLNPETTDYPNAGIAALIGELATRFKTFMGSDDAARAEHYNQLTAKYTAQLEELSRLRVSLQLPLEETIDIEETIVHSNNQRRLLQTSTSTLLETHQSYCYPNGACDLITLAEGLSGFVLQGEAEDDRSGFSVSGAGDINGDGIADLLVGASGAAPAGRTTAGRTYVVFGSRNISAWGTGIVDLSSLMNGQRGFVLQGEAANDISGISVNSAGDINGDELADLLVGAYGADPAGRIQAGKTYVVFGSGDASAWGMGTFNLSSLMNGQRGFVLQGEATGDQSGFSVSGAGDIDGDGLSDLLVGAYNATPVNRTTAGKTYVVFGSRGANAWGMGTFNLSSLMNGQRGFVLQGEAVGDYSGRSVSSAGDINGDGLVDLLAGAYFASPAGRTQAGKTYVVFGKGFNSLSFTKNDLNVNATQTVLLSLNELNVASNSTVLNLNLTYFTVSNVTHGAFASISEPTTNISAFYLQNITEGKIQFIHDGSVNVPQYRLFASHPQISQLSVIYSDAHIDFSANPPTLVKNEVAIEQGIPLNLTLNELSATDFDDPLGNLSFTISGLANGQFNEYAPNGTLLTANTSQFTQQAVMDGRIRFIPDGSRISPSYLVTVSDPRSTTTPQPVNVTRFFYEPEFYSRPIVLDQGQATLLGFVDMNATDRETSVEALIIEIANATDGYFIDTEDGIRTPIASFNQSALLANRTAFVTYRNASNVSFALRAFDGLLYTPWQSPTIQLNHLPVVQGNISDVSIAKNRLFDFTVTNVFIDPDNDTLHYQPQLETGGPLPKEIEFVSPNQFKGQLLGAERIVIQITAQDPRGLKASTSFGLENFNTPPSLTLNPIVLDQDQATTLRYQDINVMDVETFSEDILIEATNVSGGHFIYASAPDRNITAFRQLALIIGTLQFLQDGTNTRPTFALRAFDGVLYTSWQTANVTLNYKPLREQPVPDQEIIAEESFSFNLPAVLFNAVDGDNLNYTARLQGGAPLPTGIEFISPRQFKGRLSTVSSWAIEVEAKDPRGLTALAPFTLSSRAPAVVTGIDYKALYASFSSIGGVVASLLAYLWLRKRIAGHRRGFTFANTLRKVLDLEYYDFMRFDGEIYKSKLDNFLQRLQLDHQDFYTQLTSAEKESFAVCIAEILTARGLISPSDYGYGLFSIFCCLNVGWPSQLNLKRFEEENVEIATEAVATWKDCVQYKFRPLSDLAENKENGTIYIEMQDNLLSYTVMDKGVKRGGEQGSIQAEELEMKQLPSDMKRLIPHLPKVLEIAAKNGHTRTDKAFKRWPYHSPTLKEKLKVFCCLQPSHAKTFVTDVQLTHAIELEKLKKYEAADTALTIEPVADQKVSSSEFESRRLSLLEKQNKALEEQVKITTATLETMAVTIKTLSEKIETSESKFLLS